MSKQINALAATAREEGDLTSEQFMRWFIREQTAEVATMSNLLEVAERARADQADIENFVAREQQDPAGQDPTAPHAAGGGDVRSQTDPFRALEV